MTSFTRQFLGPSGQQKSTISCTPHYKDDIDKPWVNMEGMLNFSIWLGPKSTMTLENVATLIQEFLHSLFSNQTIQTPPPSWTRAIDRTTKINMEITIQSMSFRGESTPRAQMATLEATDYLHDQEPFNVSYELAYSIVRTTVENRSRLCFPCCCIWVLRNPPEAGGGQHSRDAPPQAPQMQKQ